MTLSSKLTSEIERVLSASNVLSAWLYGSYANGSATEQSDIDIALLLPESCDPWLSLPSLQLALREATGKEVNCISIIHAPVPLAYEAISGTRFFDICEQALLIEQRVWSKWEDWQHRSQN